MAATGVTTDNGHYGGSGKAFLEEHVVPCQCDGWNPVRVHGREKSFQAFVAFARLAQIKNPSIVCNRCERYI